MMNKYKGEQVAECLSKKEYEWVNGICWFSYFLKVTDKFSLEFACQWMDICIKRVENDTSISRFTFVDNYVDTKAKLLYKLGRRQEAIATEDGGL